MSKVSIPLIYCNTGDILAEDVYNDWGMVLVAKNTVMNSYIKEKLLQMNIPNVWLYNTKEQLDNYYREISYQKVKRTYKETVITVKQFISNLSSGQPVEYKTIKELSQVIFDQAIETNYIISCLKEIKGVDEYSYTHCVNVAFYSMLIANWLGLPGDRTREVIQAGLLHDIGKAKIPYEILNKNGKLTDQEFEHMKMHSTYGYDMLRDIPDIDQRIKNAVLMHHERFDGSGYPGRLKGDSIELYARIIAVADVYDAMTQNRVYKQKVSPFESFRMFLTIGISSFDITVLSAFTKNLSAFYVGTKVLLNTGATGEIVYVPPQDIVCPIVNVGTSYLDLSKEKELKVVNVF